MRLNCTLEQAIDAIVAWEQQPATMRGTGNRIIQRNHQRLGQYLWNLYGGGGSWPELFYCEDPERVKVVLWQELAPDWLQ